MQSILSLKRSYLPPAVDVRSLVDQLLADAVRLGASDLHIEPTALGCEVKLRVDGLLRVVAMHDAQIGRALVTRLMVMAKLLTYRPDVPQEGRAAIVAPGVAKPQDVRISMMPTTHGPRAAVRLPAELIQPRSLDELALPPRAVEALKTFAAGDSGMFIVTGPAGSGKTTSVYALLAHIAATTPGISIVSLEDPVERDLPGVTQIEVTPFGERTYERSLRSILRQDPQVLMLGEIRDVTCASLAVQAALSGHRLICTLHAGCAGGAVARLLEMGIEPYQITSCIAGVLSQRLVRQLRREAVSTPPVIAVDPANIDSRYKGRLPIAEFATIDAASRAAILQHADAQTLQQLFTRQPGYQSLQSAAAELVERGQTDRAEVDRVLGPAEKTTEEGKP
jgi:type II secretory ATPase GspE/PulE/Tfp pilus assembly ATPase PilB-like protein